MRWIRLMFNRYERVQRKARKIEKAVEEYIDDSDTTLYGNVFTSNLLDVQEIDSTILKDSIP